MVESKPSVSALVEEWRVLRTKCQSDLDAADLGSFDTIAEHYGEQIARMERLIADSEPESVNDIAAMLDVVLDCMESEAMDLDNPPLKMVRRVRNKVHLVARRSH